MTDTFNPVEIAEDNGLTVAQLVTKLRAQRDQLTRDCQELQNEAAEIRNRLAEYANSNATLMAKANQSQPIDQVVSKYVTDLVSSLLEGDDIRALVEQSLGQQVERVLTQPDFVSGHVEEAVEACLDGFEIECEDHVREAIEEQLQHVKITFGWRC